MIGEQKKNKCIIRTCKKKQDCGVCLKCRDHHNKELNTEFKRGSKE